ncbi:hypothetical protein [Streptomyces sp. NPDC001083]|uniref:hypothetical protein n=1 Tax=Streptomyces sp. NPDC001083 TaxID=3364545 RepID=UPI0036C7BDD8
MFAALGVLKVASADQIRRLTCPCHKDAKSVRNACLDLSEHRLTLFEGHARDGQKLWGLTTVLQRLVPQPGAGIEHREDRRISLLPGRRV